MIFDGWSDKTREPSHSRLVGPQQRPMQRMQRRLGAILDLWLDSFYWS